MTGSIFATRNDVRYRLIDGEAVVLRQTDGEVVVLNRVGSRVLELIDGERTLEAIVNQMADEFDVERHELESDVQEFVRDITEAGVIEAIGECGSR